MEEKNPVEIEDSSSDPDEVMVKNDETAEKEPHEEEQVTTNDVYTANAGVDKELLEEIRKEVQELLHGVKAPQRVEAE